jgi:methionyl-tRNA formyltransferase
MSKKIIFMGTPKYATIILQELLKNNYEIVALFTQDDKKVGRKQIITAPHIKQFIVNNNINIPIFQPKNLKEIDIQENIISLKPDFIIVAAYGQILPQVILDIAPCINLHASLLPKYRGASPIQECLINNDNYTGITAMNMELELDSGDILSLKYLKIEDFMDVEYLFDKLSYLAATLTIDVLKHYNSINPKKQNRTQASFCGKIKKQDGEVNFNNAMQLISKYKAYRIWPGLFLKSGFKLKQIETNETKSKNEAGKILEINKNNIIIACKRGSLKLIRVQQVSKKEVLATDYIRGCRLNIGDMLK